MGLDDWQAFLSERPIAVFATVGPDGGPHVTPCEVVVHDGTPYIWIDSNSVKARNALRRMRGALMAYKGQLGVLVRGPLRFVRPGDAEYDALTRAFLDKYKREETFGNDLVIAVEPHRVGTWS